MQEVIIDILNRRKTSFILYAVMVILSVYVAIGGWQYISNQQTTSEVQELNTDFKENNPIISYIPYRNPFYSISYDRLAESNSIKIKVFSESPYYRYQALDYLLKYDQEVTIKYEIEFVDYKSPLDKNGEES